MLIAPDVRSGTIEKMGDFDCGFEEMEGVKLGYLVIKGKQMFALSQVFTDLLKNIPRTTVHKRMDYLKVHKHHCDVEELRKLKAINSIDLHAAECTLISREDVEALYTSCKTARSQRAPRRNADPRSELCNAQFRWDPLRSFGEKQICLRLHDVSHPWSFKQGLGRQEVVAPPAACSLPQIYSTSASHEWQALTKPCWKYCKNYETAEKPGRHVALNCRCSLLRRVACQCAIVAPSSLFCSGRSGRERVGGRFRSSRKATSQVLLLPTCCRSQVSSDSLNSAHVHRELLPHHHHHHRPGGLQDLCSSDSESSSSSEKEQHHSDFGSRASSTSDSALSDEEEDETLSESSDATDEESSSQSDSSSQSSRASLQSIRFRRTSFSAPSSKAPLQGEPASRHDHRHSHRAANQDGAIPLVQYHGGLSRKIKNCDSTLHAYKQEIDKLWKQSNASPFPYGGGRDAGIPQPAPRTHPTAASVRETKGNKEFAQQRIPGQRPRSPQSSAPHCAQDKEAKPPTLPLNFSKEVNIKQLHKAIKPIRVIKCEKEDPCESPRSYHHCEHDVKVKEEDSCEEQQRRWQLPEGGSQPESNARGPEVRDGQGMGGHGWLTDPSITRSKEPNASLVHKCPPRGDSGLKGSSSLGSDPEEVEYEIGARVRRHYRGLVLGGRGGYPRTLHTSHSKVDRTPLSGARSSCGAGPRGFSRATKRKRGSGNVAAEKKPLFNLLGTFPPPPALIVGTDGDLSPAYSLNSAKDKGTPRRSHPVWKWQLGGSPLPLPPSHRFKTF